MKINRIRISLLVLLVLLLALSPTALAESDSAGAMRLLYHEGAVEILDPSGAPRFIMDNVRFDSGETLSTGEDGLAAVSLDDDRIVTLDHNSRAVFEKQSKAMKLTLQEGALLLDVQKKLGENETLEIRTSTMTVGIRGTIVYLTAQPDALGNIVTSTLGVLEGTAELTYENSYGVRQTVAVDRGQIATLAGTADGAVTDVQVLPLTREEIPAFVEDLPAVLPDTANRVEDALERLGGEGEDLSDSADGNWTWDQPVTLVAQSASKIFDGLPLMRPSDALVYGLPAHYTIRVIAAGAQTDAGECANVIADYAIYNARGEDVTDHFTDIQTVPGKLVVDPAPLTVWTGSATKPYDGTPLTSPFGEVTAYPGFEWNTTPWRNLSYVQTTATDAETLYGLCGVTWVHGTNPLTGETREIALQAGEKLTVVLGEEGAGQSIEFKIEPMTEEGLPEELLRLYARNPALLEQACKDTGWDAARLAERIAQLPKEDAALVTRKGLALPEDEAERLMTDCANVRITIDTDITSYNDRPLGSDEAHYTPVSIPEDIVVTPTGRQTEVGSSLNTYTISWGTSKPQNYILSEELGTLTVTAPPTHNDPVSLTAPLTHDDPVSLTAASASKTYDGTPLTAGDFTLSGLPEGFSLTATVSGSQTDAGSSPSRVSSYTILDSKGKDVTALFTNVSLTDGTLTVTPLPVRFSLGGHTAEYDGVVQLVELSSPDAALESQQILTDEEERDIGVEAVFTLPGGRVKLSCKGFVDVGSYTLSAETTFTSGKAANYSFSYTDTEMTITPMEVTVRLHDGSTLPYNGEVQLGKFSASNASFDIGSQIDEQRSIVWGGDRILVNVTGGGAALGTYTLSCSFAPEDDTKLSNYHFTVTGTSLTIGRAALTIQTPSASKPYDGEALTASPATVTGLSSADAARVTVTCTGTITSAGTVQNSYTIDWGGVDSSNYTVTEELGTLKVHKRHFSFTVYANTGSSSNQTVPYKGSWYSLIYSWTERDDDGKWISPSYNYSYTSTVNTDKGTFHYPWGDEFVLSTTGGGINPGEYPTTGSVSFKSGDPSNYVFDFTLTTLTITPAPLTITTGSASKTYDGTPLTNSEASISGLVGSQTATVTATGSQTEVGSSSNGYSIAWGSTNPANYTITEELGTLTVTPAPLTITTGSASKTYDGTPLTNSEASISGLVGSETATVTATGIQTELGSSPNTYSINWGTAKPGNYSITEDLGTLTIG